MFTLATFGRPWFGFSCKGPLYFDSAHKLGCEDSLINVDELITADIPEEACKFYLIERSQCTFVQKVRDAQHANADFVLLYDNIAEEQVENLIMIDDGSGTGLHISSAMINFEDGKKLADYIGETPQKGMDI